MFFVTLQLLMRRLLPQLLLLPLCLSPLLLQNLLDIVLEEDATMRDPEKVSLFLMCIASRFSDDESKKRAMQLAEGRWGVVLWQVHPRGTY